EAPASAPAPVSAREAAPPAASPAKPEPAQAEPATRTEPPTAEPPKTEPLKTVCKADLGRWPAGKLDQGQILQMMLRDLGFYRGTTNGTVGPQTQAAIREFQLAVGEADTGEPSEALFEALKKKCAATPP
ncbi:MAG: peptidoglycan-binding protein, partial [Reyranella sp.]|nr:peptidoglycan-binding protein [Reyranella sp.]